MDAGEFLAFNQEGEWKKGAAQQERKKEVPRLNRGLQVSFGEERMENEQEKPNFFSDPFNFECGRFHCQYDP
ncbi:hypothetical protein [Heyndrickxia coagulans]|uniref:hypothetical protein n=1 Tax=Heyndrickxia coagulans TaxID=1398 RepID=UPI0012FDF50D|nr:hypothetical protein [Heyndrickxia coagulans]